MVLSAVEAEGVAETGGQFLGSGILHLGGLWELLSLWAPRRARRPWHPGGNGLH